MEMDPDEETSYRLVKMYVEEISQRGEKRQMGLDTIINAYVYTLARLKKKKEEMGLVAPAVEKEEELLEEELSEADFESPGESEKDDLEGFDLFDSR